MNNFIYKDYKFQNGWIIKSRIIESKHLLWKFGGVPAIDSQTWDNYSKDLEGIRIYTDKGRKFEIDRDTFEAYKEDLNYGTFGKQYVVAKKFWKITEPMTYEQKLEQFSKQSL